MTLAQQTRITTTAETARYAKCIDASRRVRWDIERDVIRDRRFDFSHRFLPEGLARIDGLDFMRPEERRLLSQVQGRTYANMFGLVERFIGAKMLEISRAHWFGDQVALEALVRFADEELKHQALFRRVEELASEGMPAGYRFVPEPDAVAGAVMAASTWAVLALTCHIELFTQAHYRESLEPDSELSPLYKDVFLFHWIEESQHAIVDELEWLGENARLTPLERDTAVDDLIGLVAAVDSIVQAQADADAAYFLDATGRAAGPRDAERVGQALLEAYRWQFIVSGARHPHFNGLLESMLDPTQTRRIATALAPLMG